MDQTLSQAGPPLLGDTYRLPNPTTREFTWYPQGHRTSSSRLDYIFISPASLEEMSLLDASIHSENRATDHHQSSCTLSVPPTPSHSSEGSEYWAGIMFLRWVSSLNQPMQCIILGDNEQVIRTANVHSYVMASRLSHGTWVKAYSSLQA